MVAYSYMDAKEILKTIACLSKEERSEILNSEIARDGKTLNISLDSRSVFDCIMSQRGLERVYKQFENPILLQD